VVPLDEIATIGIAPGAQYHGNLGGFVSGTSGNSKTLVVGASGEVRRETGYDRIVLGFRSEYEDNENPDGDSRLNVQRTRGYGNYDYYLGPNWYLTGLGRLEHDRFQDLVLRTTAGGGPGYRFYDRDDLKLRLYGGLAYVYEDFRKAEDRDFLTGLLGNEFRWKVTPSLSVFEYAEIYPRVDDASDTLFHVETGVRQGLTDHLFLEVAIVDDYDTAPAPHREKNDLRYLGQVGLQF
jgi:putative salt-induced outer membrane protein YdiY